MMQTLTDRDYDLSKIIKKIIKKYDYKPTALIMVLQDIQSHYKYLPREALELVSDKMKLPLAQIYAVATFYKSFSLEPKGKHHVCVCTGTACHVRQAQVIVEKLERDLNIKTGETTEDGEYSLETVNCLGACALGPLVTADDEYYGNMTVNKVDKMFEEIKKNEDEPHEREEII